MKRVMTSGLLRFNCPKCDEVLEVTLGVTDAFGRDSMQASEDRHRMVEFIAEAPHLHATFWGHIVRCHQPNPHPYMDGGAS
jgi:hypothetical protein